MLAQSEIIPRDTNEIINQIIDIPGIIASGVPGGSLFCVYLLAGGYDAIFVLALNSSKDKLQILISAISNFRILDTMQDDERGINIETYFPIR